MSLTYRHRPLWPWPGYSDDIEVTSDGLCNGSHWQWDETLQRNVDEPAATLAHVGFEIVAQVLAAPLRKAWHDHLDDPVAQAEHRRVGGLAYCAECRRLLAMLPDGDQPVVYG